MHAVDLKDQIAAWQAAGVIDADTAARIEAFEAARPPAERAAGRITISEVIAYIGTVVLLVGLGFLYGTEYDSLGTPGRLILIGLVVAAGFAAGELVKRVGAAGATGRARAAGWSVAALATLAWFAEAFKDFDILTRRPLYDYPGASADASGSVMLAAVLATILAVFLLWRAGNGLIALVTSFIAYTGAGALIGYLRFDNPRWGGELIFLVPAVFLAVCAEVITRGHERRWAREVLRFTAVILPIITALAFSSSPEDTTLEIFGGVLALAGFGLALLRGSAGAAIAAGIGLFIFINEVGFRHFADTLGFPVVLIVSGIALFAIAGGLVRILRRLPRRA